MKIENQGEEYVKINLAQEGVLDYDIMEKIKHIECVLPFRCTEEKNTVLYHKGKNISLLEYMNLKTLDFQETRGIILSIIECFEQVEKAGGKLSNILDSLYYVYIDPVSQAVQVVYCPVVLELSKDNFYNMMKHLISGMNTRDAEMILGTVVGVLGEIPHNEDVHIVLKERLSQINSNVKIIEKKVEVDRIIEKVIEKPKKDKSYEGKNYITYTVLYFISMIVFPMLCSGFVSDAFVAKPAILNILFCLIALIVSGIVTILRERGKKDERVVVTMQPGTEEEYRHHDI